MHPGRAGVGNCRTGRSVHNALWGHAVPVGRESIARASVWEDSSSYFSSSAGATAAATLSGVLCAERHVTVREVTPTSAAGGRQGVLEAPKDRPHGLGLHRGEGEGGILPGTDAVHGSVKPLGVPGVGV
jgi:hypothetical protein